MSLEIIYRGVDSIDKFSRSKSCQDIDITLITIAFGNYTLGFHSKYPIQKYKTLIN